MGKISKDTIYKIAMESDIPNSEQFVEFINKTANKKKIEQNLKKGMPIEKAVKKAYPKISNNELKKVIKLIKSQSIRQGANSTINVNYHMPRIQDNRGRKELAVQDNRGRVETQDSHSRKWAHGSYSEKKAQGKYAEKIYKARAMHLEKIAKGDDSMNKRPIQKGETLSGILSEYDDNYYGHKYTMDELLKHNPDIADPNKIKAGETINIPKNWSGGRGGGYVNVGGGDGVYVPSYHNKNYVNLKPPTIPQKIYDSWQHEKADSTLQSHGFELEKNNAWPPPENWRKNDDRRNRKQKATSRDYVPPPPPPKNTKHHSGKWVIDDMQGFFPEFDSNKLVDDDSDIVETEGGKYPVYAKGSPSSVDFNTEFGKAKKEGKDVFEWQGRDYTTKESSYKSKADIVFEKHAGFRKWKRGKDAIVDAGKWIGRKWDNYWNNTSKTRKAVDAVTTGLLIDAGINTAKNPAVANYFGYGSGEDHLDPKIRIAGNESKIDNTRVVNANYPYNANVNYDKHIKNWNDMWVNTPNLDSVTTSFGDKENIILIPEIIKDSILHHKSNKKK